MIYLDNAATTRVSPAAAQAAANAMLTQFGNPSSLHRLGIEATHLCTSARESVAALLGCDKGEVYFTSGGTEGNNMAIFGACGALRRRGRHIVVGASEHASVLEAAKTLEAEGYEVTYLKPDGRGYISAEAVAGAVRDDTVLVSLMQVNNEVGTVMPVAEACRLVRDKNPTALVHSDCVQALGKLPGHMCDIGADIITASGHKLHAPKGVGAIYIRKGVRLLPRAVGGGQERAMRSGTESVPLIAAFGAACDEWAQHGELWRESMAAVKAQIIEGLTGVSRVEIIPGHDAPHILSISVMRYPSEVVMRMLEMRDIFVSSGSACSRGKRSHVLSAMGVRSAVTDSAIRISLCRDTTAEDAVRLIGAIKEICK